MQGNFRHAGNGAPVSREELMIVLSQLEGLYIRGLHFTETQRLTLGEVGLEEASHTGNGPRAHLVELCACPPDYTGDSCQVGNFPSMVFLISWGARLCLAFSLAAVQQCSRHSWGSLYPSSKCTFPWVVFRDSKHVKDSTVS